MGEDVSQPGRVAAGGAAQPGHGAGGGAWPHRAVYPAARSSPWIRLREPHPPGYFGAERKSWFPDLGVSRHPTSRVDLPSSWGLPSGAEAPVTPGPAPSQPAGRSRTPPSPVSTAASPACEVAHPCHPWISWEPQANELAPTRSALLCDSPPGSTWRPYLVVLVVITWS